MSKRINIVLPEATVQTIDRMAKRCQRSRFIDQAVQHFVANRSTEALRAQLERTAVGDQDLDREIAADWFVVATKHGNNSTMNQSQLPKARRDLPHGARPDARVRDSEDPASAHNSEWRF